MNKEDSGYIREKINDLWSEFLNITQENKIILNENSNDLLNLKENVMMNSSNIFYIHDTNTNTISESL